MKNLPAGNFIFIDCLVPSLPHLPSTWCKQPPSLLLPYPIYRRGELTILPQDEEFTCCYFNRPFPLSLYLFCNIIYLGCDFACDIYTKV
jgi:hypothetical protein